MHNEAFEVLALGLMEEQAVSRRKMFGWDCLFVNGNSFLGGSDRGMLFKLDESDLEKAIGIKGIERFDPMGSGKGMLGWVVAARGTEAHWPSLSHLAMEYVSQFPPKGTGKPSSKAAKKSPGKGKT